MDDVGKSYIIGQEYMTQMIDVKIKYFMYSNVILKEELSFILNDKNVRIYNEFGRLVIEYYRKISANLISDLETENKGFNFLAGYLKGILDKINLEINKYKYRSAHILNRPISIYDVIGCEINIDNSKEKYDFGFDLSFPEFPPLAELEIKYDKFYVHEFIDAITSYLYNNLDDSIRKIITSLEDAFNEYNIPKEENNKILYFRDRLNRFVDESNYKQWKNQHLKILKSNMNFIYTLRNKIVHENLRIDYSDFWFEIAIKGIKTLRYIYTSNIIEGELIDYIFDIEVMLDIIDNYIINLDDIMKVKESGSDKCFKTLNTKRNLDNYVFQQLEISNKTRKLAIP